MLMPTLHCLCRTDPMNPAELGEAVAGCFAPRGELLWHEGGHALPPRGPGGLDAMEAWIERALAEAETREQGGDSGCGVL